MNDYLDRFSGLIGVPGWILSAFLIILGALLLELIYRIFIGHLANLAEKSGHMWDDAIVYAGRRPISLLIWWQGMLMAARVIEPHSDALWDFRVNFLKSHPVRQT